MTTGKELSPSPQKPKTPLPSLAQFGLESWRASDWIPDKAKDVAALEHAREALDDLLKPATDDEFEDEILLLLKCARTFGIPVESAESAVDFYTEQLGTLPAIFLRVACERIRGANWYGRMPMPHAIRAMVRDEFFQANWTRTKIDMVLKRHARDRLPKRPALDPALEPYGAPFIGTRALRAMVDAAATSKFSSVLEDISPEEFEKKRAEFQAAADAENT